MPSSTTGHVVSTDPSVLAAQVHATASPTEVVRVPLVGGRTALIDVADLDLVGCHRWYCLPTPSGRFYATTEIAGRILYMHRLIAATPSGLTTDHRNNDGLDNRRANLRIAEWFQNAANRPKQMTRAGRDATSRFKGVCWDRRRSKWHARIKVNGTHMYLGRFESEVEAAKAYDAAAALALGEFAVLNFPAVAA